MIFISLNRGEIKMVNKIIAELIIRGHLYEKPQEDISTITLGGSVAKNYYLKYITPFNTAFHEFAKWTGGYTPVAIPAYVISPDGYYYGVSNKLDPVIIKKYDENLNEIWSVSYNGGSTVELDVPDPYIVMDSKGHYLIVPLQDFRTTPMKTGIIVIDAQTSEIVYYPEFIINFPDLHINVSPDDKKVIMPDKLGIVEFSLETFNLTTHPIPTGYSNYIPRTNITTPGYSHVPPLFDNEGRIYTYLYKENVLNIVQFNKDLTLNASVPLPYELFNTCPLVYDDKNNRVIAFDNEIGTSIPTLIFIDPETMSITDVFQDPLGANPQIDGDWEVGYQSNIALDVANNRIILPYAHQALSGFHIRYFDLNTNSFGTIYISNYNPTKYYDMSRVFVLSDGTILFGTWGIDKNGNMLYDLGILRSRLLIKDDLGVVIAQ